MNEGILEYSKNQYKKGPIEIKIQKIVKRLFLFLDYFAFMLVFVRKKENKKKREEKKHYLS